MSIVSLYINDDTLVEIFKINISSDFLFKWKYSLQISLTLRYFYS